MARKKRATPAYTVDDLTSLPYPDIIRKRPGMFVGGRGPEALLHLVKECVDNAVDEAAGGFCRNIGVVLHQDGSISIADDGRGVPPEMHPDLKKPGFEVSFATIYSGAKFADAGAGSYSTSIGLHGVGVKATNALSQWLRVEVRRYGLRFRQSFAGGLPATAVDILAPHEDRIIGQVQEGVTGRQIKALAKEHGDKALGTGTTVTFLPDPTVLEETEFEFEPIRQRLQELSYLLPGVTTTICDERGKGKPVERAYCNTGGLRAYVEHLNKGRNNLHPSVIEASGESNGVAVDVAMQWHDGDFEEILTFVNNVPTVEGGTHLTGLRSAVTKAVNVFGSESRGLKKKGDQISGSDATMGLTCVLRVRMPDPEFDAQTKTSLRSPIGGTVLSLVYDPLLAHFRKRTAVGRAVVQACLRAARARAEAAKARELVIRNSVLDNASKTGLPEKLADVSKETPLAQTTLVLVEGDSAGGSCKQARDRRYFAILPLRGKGLNVEGMRPAKILANAEVRAIVAALGGGFGRDFDVDSLRYGQVAILADSDVDGAHIQTLLLTLFARQMLPLVEAGRLYIMRAPLYLVRGRRGGEASRYLYTDKELEAVLGEWGRNGTTIQRYKGLGEMNPAQLRETVFQLGDPNPGITPHMVRIKIADMHAANETIALWMGKGSSVVPRRRRRLLRLWDRAAAVVDEENGNGEEDEELDDDLQEEE